MKVAESKITARHQTSVPPAIREGLKLEVGDYLEWHVMNSQVIVKKKEVKE